jgi:hypothetical protein
LEPRLNGAGYLEFLENTLPLLLDELPAEVNRDNIVYQHDGAPAHFSLLPRRWLDVNFEGRWIGRGGPIVWPPRSPDMNPLDYCLWGHWKTCIYRNRPNTVEEVTGRLHEATALFTEDSLGRATGENLIRRARLCIQHHGEQLGPYL